ncbi:MAG TPA: M23 family metallopeptidase [Bacteroidales bacterium]|nr:M23 family metallopeptidase [Bacteroidales bacterium]
MEKSILNSVSSSGLFARLKGKPWVHIGVLLVAGFFVILLFVFFHPVPHVADDQSGEEIPMFFGFPVSEYEIQSFEVNPGENLSLILSGHGIDATETDRLLRVSRGIFDPRKLRAGQPYHVLTPRDTTRPDMVIYEVDYINYVVFNLKDSLYVFSGAKPVIRVWDTVAGSIEQSLWASMVQGGGNPALAMRLSDIYAWTIDFYGIQPGDAYKVVFERLIVDTTEVGLGIITAAWFSHNGQQKYAFRFEQDSVPDYFDDEGQSLRRAFLKAPLQFSRISSRFSHSRLHPVLRIRRPHHGVDYAAPVGTPVQSVGDGVVIKMGWAGGAGRMVKIKHNSTYTTAYLHLSGYGKGIREGKRVSQGEVIGYVGSSGLSTGPHLDFRFYQNGHPIDPLKVVSPPTDPVKKENMPQFNIIRDSLRSMLDGIPVAATSGR